MTKLSIKSDVGEARGRNGWFQPDTAWIHSLRHVAAGASADQSVIDLTVNSKRIGDMAPIVLRLPRAEMAALAQELLQACGAPDPPVDVVENHCSEYESECTCDETSGQPATLSGVSR
jgi:hypothetical protein